MYHRIIKTSLIFILDFVFQSLLESSKSFVEILESKGWLKTWDCFYNFIPLLSALKTEKIPSMLGNCSQSAFG